MQTSAHVTLMTNYQFKKKNCNPTYRPRDRDLKIQWDSPKLFSPNPVTTNPTKGKYINSDDLTKTKVPPGPLSPCRHDRKDSYTPSTQQQQQHDETQTNFDRLFVTFGSFDPVEIKFTDFMSRKLQEQELPQTGNSHNEATAFSDVSSQIGRSTRLSYERRQLPTSCPRGGLIGGMIPSDDSQLFFIDSQKRPRSHLPPQDNPMEVDENLDSQNQQNPQPRRSTVISPPLQPPENQTKGRQADIRSYVQVAANPPTSQQDQQQPSHSSNMFQIFNDEDEDTDTDNEVPAGSANKQCESTAQKNRDKYLKQSVDNEDVRRQIRDKNDQKRQMHTATHDHLFTLQHGQNIITSISWLGTLMFWENGTKYEMIPDELSEWRTTLVMLTNKQTTFEEAQQTLPMKIKVCANQSYMRRTPGNGWCFLLSIAQIILMKENQLTLEQTQVLFTKTKIINKVLDDLIKYLSTPETSMKLSQIRTFLRDPRPALPPELWLSTKDQLNYDRIGHITWVTEDYPGFTVTDTNFEAPLPICPRAEAIVKSHIIGYHDHHFFFIALAATRVQMRDRINTYIETNVAKLKNNKPAQVDMDYDSARQQLDTIDISTNRDIYPTHVLITNFSPQAQQNHISAKETIRAVMTSQPYVVTMTDDMEANWNLTEVRLCTASLAFLVPCIRDDTHSSTPPPFFLGEDAELANRKYTLPCTLLGQDDAKTLASDKDVVAVQRGLTKHVDIDNVFVRAFNLHCERKQIVDVTYVIENLSHKISDRDCREPVIIMYSPKRNAQNTPTEVRRKLGFHDKRQEMQINFYGIRMIAYLSLEHARGRRLPDLQPAGVTYAIVSNIHEDTTDQQIASAMFTAYPPEKVKYWVFSTSQTGKTKRLLIAFQHLEMQNDVNHHPWQEMQSLPHVPKYIEYDKPLPRHRDIGWIYDTMTRAPSSQEPNTMNNYLIRKNPTGPSPKQAAGEKTARTPKSTPTKKK